jgi:hypothetical protein
MKLYFLRFELNKKNRSSIIKDEIVFFFKLRDIKALNQKKDNEIIAQILWITFLNMLLG